MLAHESTYCVAVPGGNAEVSLNGLRAILEQVEAELHHSEIYGQMLSNLKALPDELNKQVQCMVRAVGREAIRLALRKMVCKKPLVAEQQANLGFANHVATTPTPKPLHLAAQPSANSPNREAIDQKAIAGDRDLPANIAVLPIERQAAPVADERRIVYPPIPSHLAKPLANPHKKLSKRELARRAALEVREACLQELGRTIRQVRQEKSWSPYHLHIKTQIPMHQLEALETGCIERLPEDIYLRGFIRQAGNALGLDGNQMAASLPAIDPATTVLPSWQKPKAHSGLHLNSMHIYLGYAALMAGGIAWVSYQSIPQQRGSAPTATPATVAPQPKTSPTQPIKYKANPKNTAALNAKQATVTPGAVSPPENSPL